MITINLTVGKLVLISVLAVTDYATRPCTDVSKYILFFKETMT